MLLKFVIFVFLQNVSEDFVKIFTSRVFTQIYWEIEIEWRLLIPFLQFSFFYTVPSPYKYKYLLTIPKSKINLQKVPKISIKQ